MKQLPGYSNRKEVLRPISVGKRVVGELQMEAPHTLQERVAVAGPTWAFRLVHELLAV